MKRRTAIKTAGVSGVAVIAPSFATVVSGDTSSGEVELTTDSTIPTDTTITITVNEDTSGDGTADNTEQITLSGGSGETNQLDTLTGTTETTNAYWLEISLDTTDTSVTPELSSAELALPAGTTDGGTGTDTGDSEGFSEIIDNYLFFITAMVMSITGITGLASKSLAVGAVAGYTAFAYFAITLNEQLLENILVVTLVMVLIGFAFKFWRLEGTGGT